jgi:hypothetical protein
LRSAAGLPDNPRPDSVPAAVTESDRPQATDHAPQGTLTIVAVFGAFVVVGWLLLFFGLFVPRGTH